MTAAALTLGLLLVVPPQDTSPHSLVSALQSASPGKPFLVGVRIQMDKGWHSYWKNPGDSGLPTTVAWNLPTGWKASGLRWPIPRSLIADGQVVYGYEDEVIILATITPPKTAKASASVPLRAQVRWLICEASCLTASQNVVINVGISSSPEPNKTWGPKLQAVQGALARANPNFSVGATIVDRSLQLSLRPPPGIAIVAGTRFIAAEPNVIAHSKPQKLLLAGKTYYLTVPLSEYASAVPKRLKGLLVAPDGTTWAEWGRAIEINVRVQSTH